MTTLTHTPKTVFEKLIQPVSDLIDNCTHKRKCNTLTDQQWIETGLLKTLSQEPSGRAFVQKLFDSGRTYLRRSHLFETLKSSRRLNVCQEIGSLLYEKLGKSREHSDPFQLYAELSDYDIYAGDGHYHAAATHDVRKDGNKHPTQHFYSVDLRTHGLKHLTLADTSGNRKREHDTRALKRLDVNTLRQGAPKGRKVLYVWDRACIDFMQWFKWKHTSGVYFISREKKNMDLLVMADLPFDAKNKVNKGVESYEMVGCSAGVSLFRIKYTCPVSGEAYHFVTNVTHIPPGLVAYLYKTRWDIEKIFDQVKNKLNEKKAWATSDTAKIMQAQFICLTHNLMLMLEDLLKKEGVDNETENKRREQRLKNLLAKSKVGKEELPEFLSTPKRPSQRTVKFIRWLRNHLFSNTSWREALLSLKMVYDCF